MNENILEKFISFNKDIVQQIDQENELRLKNEQREGFYVSKSSIKFVSNKNYLINYDWELRYDEITGVAYCDTMYMDDEGSFIIFVRGNKKPIILNTTYFGLECIGIDDFYKKLEEWKMNQHSEIEENKVIISYPKILRGEELYYSWYESIGAFFHPIIKIFRNYSLSEFIMSGVIKKEFRQYLKIH